MSGSLTVTGSITTPGTLTAQTLVVQTITSSIDFVTGSTRFGSILGNTHVFSGSVTMNPGGLFVSSSGVVGIGNTNPLTKFVVATTSNVNFEVRNGADYGVTGVAIDSRDDTRSTRNAMLVYGSPIILGGGNVGMGTTNPSYKLVVNSGTDGISAGIAGSTYGIRFDNGGTFSSGMSTIHGVDSTLTGTYQPIMINGSDVRFGTSATERMRITSGGNVGIGVTPSAWATLTPLQIKNVAFAGYTSGNTHVLYAASNFYYNDGDKYITNGQASLYSQSDGSHTWYTAGTNSSGAGASLSFTERLKLTNTGALFHKGYVNGNLMGGFSVVGTISAINTGDRYLHVRINTIGSMMYWIKVFGYVYTTNIIEGLGGGYVGGGTGGVNQAFQNGAIVAQYQNGGYVEIVVDTVNTSTTNRWGSITFLGGTDAITTVQALEIMTYSWTNSTSRVY